MTERYEPYITATQPVGKVIAPEPPITPHALTPAMRQWLMNLRRDYLRKVRELDEMLGDKGGA